MGEEGEGRLCRRVHGSASLTGEPKPSYFTVRREHAPLTVTQTGRGLLLTCRGVFIHRPNGDLMLTIEQKGM